MKNYVKDVAKSLELKLDEPFFVKEGNFIYECVFKKDTGFYTKSKYGLFSKQRIAFHGEISSGTFINNILTGKSEVRTNLEDYE
jgi:hypothetical protein